MDTAGPAKRIVSLDGIWQLDGVDRDGGAQLSLPGTVPGMVHPDLLAAGRIPDPFWRDQAEQCQWVEKWDWSYSRSFDLPPGFDTSWVELEFGGLDTYAEIVLNGKTLGHTANMFIPHRFEVGALLRQTGNELKVSFTPYQRMIAGKSLDYPAAFFTSDRLHVRRLQCTFHWDWVNRFVSFGIWRPVTLSSYTSACIRDLFVDTRALGRTSAALQIEVEVERRSGEAATAMVAIAEPSGATVWQDTVKVNEATSRISADLADPQLWWPHGYGAQPLYRCRVVLSGPDGTVLDTRETTFGIRTARIEQLPDRPGTPEWQQTMDTRQAPWPGSDSGNGAAPGKSFTLVVNGERIFCKGGNWVPADPFPARISPARYDRLIRLARDGNLNLLRCWGGGIYEPPAFWDACNRYGVMISQDFMMACGAYPADDPDFMAKLRPEIPAVVRLLRNHPSLVWWAGDNENGMHHDFDDANAPYAIIASQITGPTCRELDPSRTFMPSSPFGGRKNTSITIGDSHFSAFFDNDLRFVAQSDMRDYRERINLVGRFMSESAMCGAPPLRSLLKFMTTADLADPAKRLWEFRTKDNPHKPAGQTITLFGMLERLAETILGPARDLNDKIRKMEYIHYEWVRLVVEAARRSKWYCSGIQFWMYNDCWPASGWSMVDYYGFPKAGWYAMKRSSQPVIAALERTGSGYRVWVCNDRLTPVSGTLRLAVQPWTGAPRWTETLAVQVAANASGVVRELADAALCGLGHDAILVAELAAEDATDRAVYYPGMPHEMALPPATLTVRRADASATAGTVTVSTDHYARVVTLAADLEFSDNYFDLLPGEVRTIRWRNPEAGTVGDIPVTCWNDSP
jgi:beta-mannosidase